MADTVDITSLQSDIKTAFSELKVKADRALDDLNSFATGNDASAVYNGDKTKTSFLYRKNAMAPVENIKVADSMINRVESLAAQISTVTYTPPDVLDPSFKMEKTKVWQDDFANKIELSLSGYIDTMGIPSKEFQDAIFNESYDRNLQTLNDLYDLADAKTGARGFTYPNSMTTVLKLDAQQKYQFDRNQVSRDVTKLTTEWARQNYQFAIEKGISFEQFHADFTVKYCTAFVDIYKNLVLVSIERFKADLSKYVEPIKAYIDAAKLPVETAKINADIDKVNADLYLEDSKLQIQEATQVFQTQTQSSIATFSEQIKSLQAIAAETAKFIQSASRSVIGIQK